MALKKMTKVGIEKEFPLNNLDPSSWPGRELKWMWIHPALTTVIFLGFVGFVISLGWG